MNIDFEKWHGCLNDFIVIWLDNKQNITLDSLIRNAPSLCNRKGAGIGADGILVLLYNDTSSALMPDTLKIINSDGSIATTCGNGLRVAGSSLLINNFLQNANYKDIIENGYEFCVEGSKVFLRFSKAYDLPNSIPWVAVDMGLPKIGKTSSFYNNAVKEVERASKELNLPQLKNEYYPCELLNNHLVFFLHNIDKDLLYKVGPFLQHSSFWDGINVHLVSNISESKKDTDKYSRELGEKVGGVVNALIWERGAGETASCGSGAAAIAACIFNDLYVSRSNWIAVNMPGGSLFLRQKTPDDNILLTGPAKYLFKGTIEI